MTLIAGEAHGHGQARLEIAVEGDIPSIRLESPLDNILLPCHFSARRRQRPLAQSPTLAAKAARLLARLQLTPDLWQRPPVDLSVGQQQRVAAAHALIGRRN